MKKLLTLLSVILFAATAGAQVSNTSSPALAISNSTNACTGSDGAGGVTDTIAFTESGTISDVNVTVEIDHTWRADLQFHVAYSVGSAGNVIMAADHGSSADDYYAILDSDSAIPCSDGTNGCGASGNCTSSSMITCAPDNDLGAFNGLTSPGTWTLQVCDDAGGDDGTLQSWTVQLFGDGDLPVELLGFQVE